MSSSGCKKSWHVVHLTTDEIVEKILSGELQLFKFPDQVLADMIFCQTARFPKARTAQFGP